MIMTEDINKALDVLKKGGVILYPTDPIWGLGCDATNQEAVNRIYKIKQRADNKSMIVLVDHPGRIAGYIDDIPEVAMQLIELADKPLTIILEGAKNMAQNVINTEDKSIGIRVVNEPFCHTLISRFKKPIVSTSANKSGQPSPLNFAEISEEIINQVDYVVNYRQDDITKYRPSGIVKIGKDCSVKVIRE